MALKQFPIGTKMVIVGLVVGQRSHTVSLQLPDGQLIQIDPQFVEELNPNVKKNAK